MSKTYVAKPDMKILLCIAGLAAHHGATWCFPSQEKILEILRQRYGRRMSRRTLNNHLGALEKSGHLERIRRHKTSANGSLWLRSTLYKCRQKAVAFVGLAAKTLDTFRAHAWAKRWLFAVKKDAQCDREQSNIICASPVDHSKSVDNSIHPRKTRLEKP